MAAGIKDRRLWILPAALACFVAWSGLPCLGFAIAEGSADAIIQRSVQANQRDWDAAPQFDFSERDYAAGGNKTYEQKMILGSPYQRLIEVDRKPLTPVQAAAENRKFEIAVAQRRKESARKRSQRIAKYQADRKRNHSMMQELVKAFVFKVQSEGHLDGHAVYVIQAKPRPGYRPPTMETQALTGMEGTLWIDKDSFQWVKVEAQVTRPVSIEGFLAKVEPGTHFELEKTAVAPGIWLPKHFSMHSRAKILFVYSREDQEEEDYFDFHRTSAGDDVAPTTSSAAQ